jgi:hypothetical protein
VCARVAGDQLLVTWSAYNRWAPELLIHDGELDVARFATAAELEAAVRIAVYRVDPLMWSTVDCWAVG